MKALIVTAIIFAFTAFSAFGQASPEAVRKIVAKGAPAAVGQVTATKKERPDTEDARLKGKVKLRVVETADITPVTQKEKNRKIFEFKEFDANGYLIMSAIFQEGKLFEVSNWGYIDGARASLYKTQPDVGIFMLTETDELQGTPKKADERYSYKYLYKYVDGKLAEEQYINNTGDPWIRYAYSYTGNTLTEMIFLDKDKLNERTISTLDAKGNEIEKKGFDIDQASQPHHWTETTKYITFDAQGNWTKKITSSYNIVMGKSVLESSTAYYRTLTYHP